MLIDKIGKYRGRQSPEQRWEELVAENAPYNEPKTDPLLMAGNDSRINKEQFEFDFYLLQTIFLRAWLSLLAAKTEGTAIGG